MNIKKVTIENFKCFKGKFVIELNKGLNILVGDNEAGKSTILEAIHLALTGILNGKYLKNELTQYLFNNEIVSEYLESIKKKIPVPPPQILVELFIEGNDIAIIEGDGAKDKKAASGVSLKIAFDDSNQHEYNLMLAKGEINTIPIEYYDVYWTDFSRQGITSKSIPIKSALIDSSSTRYQNGSDVYISRIVKDFLDPKDIIDISQAHRKMKDIFMTDPAIANINEKIRTTTQISDKSVALSVDLSSKNAWENSLMTYFDKIPFHHIGKGEQCIIKTKLALGHKKSKEANLILLEEPENHLSHSKLNQLIREIKSKCSDKQIIVSTHSSFVANKLGLDNLILLNNKRTVRLNDLGEPTEQFFEKLAGYDTLRLILCKKAILVEGDSDELIVQKAYQVNNNGKIPIEDGIDVISVGTSFLQFLKIADKIDKDVSVVTDNDGDIQALNKKYEDYVGENAKSHISIHFDSVIDAGDLKIKGKQFNYNTLEPKFVKVNGLEKINSVLGTTYKSSEIDKLHAHMKANKTTVALKVFDTKEEVKFPQYILDAIK